MCNRDRHYCLHTFGGDSLPGVHGTCTQDERLMYRITRSSVAHIRKKALEDRLRIRLLQAYKMHRHLAIIISVLCGVIVMAGEINVVTVRSGVQDQVAVVVVLCPAACIITEPRQQKRNTQAGLSICAIALYRAIIPCSL